MYSLLARKPNGKRPLERMRKKKMDVKLSVTILTGITRPTTGSSGGSYKHGNELGVSYMTGTVCAEGQY
jgi:hypothetical protein